MGITVFDPQEFTATMFGKVRKDKEVFRQLWCCLSGIIKNYQSLMN